MEFSRRKNRTLSFLAARFPVLGDRLVESFHPLEYEKTPWAEVTRPLAESRVAIVTTAGVHHQDQKPFDMADPNGDPSFRLLDADTIENDYTITHDYYDHKDALKDLNVVFPLSRLKEMEAAGCIGSVAGRHLSFMGHIKGPHIGRLTNETAPAAADFLKQNHIDCVLLTPA